MDEWNSLIHSILWLLVCHLLWEEDSIMYTFADLVFVSVSKHFDAWEYRCDCSRVYVWERALIIMWDNSSWWLASYPMNGDKWSMLCQEHRRAKNESKQWKGRHEIQGRDREKKKKSFTSHNGGFAEIITILLRNMVFNDRIVKTI